MGTISAERPQFFEGQYLGADDLAAIVEYLRTSLGRLNLGQHSWGIAIGLDLVSQPVTDSTVEYYLQPGVAVDGYGRIIVVSNPTRIEADAFAGSGSGNIDVWINYRETEFAATRPGFGTCGAVDDYARVNESFEIVVGNKTSILERQGGVTVNDAALVDAREAPISVNPEADLLCDASVPHQDFPYDKDNAIWLVPLGHVKWSSALNGFLPLVDAAELEALDSGSGSKTPDQVYEALMAGRAKRRLLGVVAESVFAAEGLLRLRERTTPPDPALGNDAVCADKQVLATDLQVCDGRLKPKELVWVEGNLRVEGDTRLFSGRLEFRDSEGRDYVNRQVGGVLVTPITPTLMQRREGNARGGVDLQLLLGKSANGTNRFTVGNIEFDGTDLCNLNSTVLNQVVVQDNGMLGIGTTNPDSVLEAPYTVRGLQQTVTEDAGTVDEVSYNVYRLESYQADDGNLQWQLDLWDSDKNPARKSLNLTESGLAKTRLFLETGGYVGIGTTEPLEQLHVKGDGPALMIDVNATTGTNRSDLKFASDGVTGAGLYWDTANDQLHIHHGGDSRFVIDRDKVGMGTNLPKASMHIQNGTDVTLNDDGGFLLLGDVNGLNVVLDDNEIQARNNGAASALHAQAEGGDFIVHFWNSATQFQIKDNGNVGIGTATPNAKLDVRGDIRLGASGDYHAVSAGQRLHTVAGRINDSGSIGQGTGFNVSPPHINNSGVYTILFSPAFATAPVVVACPFGHTDNVVSVTSVSPSTCVITCYDVLGSNAGVQDIAFTFIAVGER